MTPRPPSPRRRGAVRRRAGRRWSVDHYLALIVLTAVTLTVITLGGGFVWATAQAKATALRTLRAEAEVASRSLADAVAAARDQVTTVATQPGIEAVLDRPDGCSLVAHGSAAVREVRMGIVRADGDVLCSSAEGLASSPGLEHAGSAWLDALGPSPTTVWSAEDGVTGRAAAVVLHPLPAVAGADAPAGAVAVFIDLAGIAEGLHSAHAMPGHAVVTVVDVAEQAVVSSPLAPPATALPAGWDATTTGTWVGLDGVPYLHASEDVEGAPWRVYAAVPQRAVVADAWRLLGTQAPGAVVGLAGLVLLVWILHRRISGPLQGLTAAVTEARQGASRVRMKVEGTAEVVALAREYNAMLDLRVAHETRLAHWATHDRVTGLPTDDLLLQALTRPEGDAPPDAVLACVGLLGIDGLTDLQGPGAADRVLTRVGARLRALRTGDVVARTGPAEIMLLRTGAGGDAAGLADEVASALAGLPELSGGSQVRAFVGAAVADGDAPDQRLLREAAAAMSWARSSGTASAVFEESMRSRQADALWIEQGLRAALAVGGIDVHYQPIVAAASTEVVGVEALARWTHPDRGPVPPADFIPVAEESGLIGDLGRLVLRQACAQAADWLRQGLRLTVSVNVAAAQLRDPGFARTVRDALRDSALPADLLCLEVTESDLVTSVGGATALLAELRRSGVRAAIDDFGTGLTSLAYLRDLPVDELKIDRSFVAGLGRDGRSGHVVAALVTMARDLGLTVVAEGVETEDQLAALVGLRCTYAQGYLIARPQPAAALPALVAARAPRLVGVAAG